MMISPIASPTAPMPSLRPLTQLPPNTPRDPGNGSNEVPAPGTPPMPRDSGDGSNGHADLSFDKLISLAHTIADRSIELVSMPIDPTTRVSPATNLRGNTANSIRLIELALGRKAPQAALDAANGARIALLNVLGHLDLPTRSLMSHRDDLVAARDLLGVALTEYSNVFGPRPQSDTDLQGNGQGPDIHPPALDPGKRLQGNGQGPDVMPAA